VGANAIVGAIKVGRLLALGRIAIHPSGSTITPLETADAAVLLGGVLAAAVVGMISVRDGIARLTS
jgi:hypothetical protein